MIKKLTAILVLIVFCFSAIVTVYASDGSVFYSKRGDTVLNSRVTVKGTAQNTKLPVNMIVSDISASNIQYINQTMPANDGTWSFSFDTDGRIYDYNILLRQDGVVTNSVVLDEIMSISDAIDSTLAATIVDDIINADITINNPMLIDAKCTLYVAMYTDNGELVAVEGIDLSTVSQLEKFSDNYQCNMANGADYVRVFLWCDNLTPMTKDVYASEAASNFTINCVESDELITKNPGKGWVRYGVNNAEYNDDYGVELDEKAIDYSSVAYFRYNWSDIETADDVYNWAPIDNAINYWKQRGIKFAFGVMNANTSPNSGDKLIDNKYYITPKWVFDLGAASVTGKGTGGVNVSSLDCVIPVFNDEIYLAECTEFVNALAERYDGNPDVAWIDIRSYGNYGEFHILNMPDGVVALNEADMKKHIEMYDSAFDTTRLAICTGAFYSNSNNGYIDPSYLIEKGIAVRHDGANTIQEEMAEFDGYVPTISEIGPPYVTYKEQKGWDTVEFLNHFKYSKLSYMDIGEWGTNTQAFIKEQEPVIKYLTNKMGYHFVLNSVELPTYAYVDNEFNLSFNWTNKGITYLYEDCTIDVALLNADNEVVKKVRSSAKPKLNWAPDSVVNDAVSMTFGAISDGDYKLCVGLHHDDDAIPDYKIGNKGVTPNGWYAFANVEKVGNRFKFAPHITGDASQPEADAFTNGSFENGTASWDMSNTGLFTVNTQNKTDGTNSLCFAGNSVATLSQDFDVDNEYVYNFSFDVKCAGVLNYKVTDSYGNVLSEGTTTAKDGFSTYKLNFDIFDAGIEVFGEPVSDMKVKLVFETTTDTPVAYIDNVTLSKQPYSDFKNDGYLVDYGAEISNIKWQRRSNSKVERTSEDASSGTYSFKISPNGNVYSGAQYPLTDLVNLGGAGTYKFEAKLRASDGHTIDGVSCYGFYYNGKVFGDASINSGWYYADLKTSWQTVSAQFILTEDIINEITSNNITPVALIGFKEDISDTSGNPKYIYFDDVKITKVN